MTARASAPTRRSTRNRLRGETSRRVIATLISTGMVLQPLAAQAGPTNGTVVGGNATISAAGNTTTIEQIDSRVVIDWESFDIDTNETVKFAQPGKQSVALNRVLGELPSHIRGQLLANGHVWIVNRNGVTFHAGSVVNVGGLLATTSDITNADFMAGRNNFTIPGKDGATVTNHGSISFGDAGLAGLVAPGAANHGQIAGKLGSVIVAGERTFAIDFAGDGMFAFEPKGAADFRGKATNTGTISNKGGYILIAARTASGMVDESISLGGVVEATSAEMKDGRIVLSAGDGLVNVAGTLDASGGEGQGGGTVKVSGGRVALTETAKIDVSGGTGGGTAEIGGGWQGQSMGDGLRNAQDTRVQRGATIVADAGQSGDGGTVVVWADGSTGYAGAITATGGTQSGNGGRVEVSGKQDLGFYGQVDTTAPNGETGTLLLDPRNITIRDMGADDAEIADNTINFADGGNGNFSISTDAIDMAGAQVKLRATNDIRFEDDVSTRQNLNLAAGNDIRVNSSVTTTRDLKFVADASSEGSGAPDAGPRNDDGTIIFNADGSLTGRNIELNTGESLRLGQVNASGTLVATAKTGVISQQANTGVVVDGDATFTAESGISLNRAPNDLRAGLTATTRGAGAPVTVVDTGSLSVLSVTAGTAGDRGDADLTATGAINLGQVDADLVRVTTTTGNADITDTDVAAGNSITANIAVLTATGDVIVDSPSNDFVDGVTARADNVTIRDQNSVKLSDIDTDDLDVEALGGEITQSNTAVAGQAVDATGITTLTATGDIRLRNALNDFGGTVNADGAAIALRDANAVRLGTVAAGDTLTVDAGTTLRQRNVTGVTAVGATRLTAADEITLESPTNDFGTVAATTTNADADISLQDSGAVSVTAAAAGTAAARGDLTVNADDIQLGDIDADTLVAIARTGNIDDIDTAVAGDAIDVARASLIAEAGNVTVDAEANDFTTFVLARSNQVTIKDRNSVKLNDIDATDLDVEALGGEITQSATTTAGQAVDVTGTTTLEATDRVRLANARNDFGGAVDAAGTDVTLADTNAIEVGAVTADSLSVAATDASVSGAVALGSGSSTFSDTSGSGTTVVGAAAGDADDSSFELTDTDLANIDSGEIAAESNGNAIDVQGAALAVAGQDLTLDGGGAGTVSFTTAATSTTGPDGDLTVRNAGDVSQTAAGTLDIDGDVSIVVPGSAIALNEAGNSVTGTVNAEGTNVDLAATALQLGAVTATGDLMATSGAALTQDGSGVTVAGETTLSGTAITLAGPNDFDSDDSGDTVTVTSTGAITLNDIDDLRLASLSAGGDVTITAGGSLAATGNIMASAGNIVLSATTGSVVLADLTAPANLTVTAGTTILQRPATGIDVTGAAMLTAGDRIRLESATNDFSTVAATTMNADSDISIRDANALTASSASADGRVTLRGASVELGDIDAGRLDVTADTGDITDIDTDVADDAIDTGIATLNATAGNVIVDAEANDFTGAVTARGVQVTLSDANSIALGDVDADALNVAARGGDITQSTTRIAGQAVDVTGDTVLSATGDAALNNARNDFGGRVDADAVDVALRDAGDLSLGDIDADGDLSAQAATALTQVAVDDNVTVAGATTLIAESIALDTATGNDFDSDGNGDKLNATASAGDISITDLNDLTLGEVRATGGDIDIAATDTLMVMGNLRQDNGIAGTTTLTSDTGGAGGENIVLSDGVIVSTTGSLLLTPGAGSALTDGPNAGAGGVRLVSGTAGGGNAFILPQTVFSALDLTILADGSIMQSASARLMARLRARTTGDPITLDDGANDFMGPVSTVGSDVVLTDATALILGDTVADSLALNTGGEIRQASGETVTAAVEANTAGGDIRLNNADNQIATLSADTTIGGVAPARVTVRSVGGIELGDIEADRLVVQAIGGNVTDVDTNTAGDAINAVRANLIATTGDVIVDAEANDFADGAAASGNTVTLTDANSVRLADIDATTLTVNARGGDITQTTTPTAGQGVNVTGTTSLDATGNALLGNDVNDFGGAVKVDATDVALADANGIQLGDIDAGGTLSVDAGGPISQTDPVAALAAIDVTGNTTLDANGSTITLESAFNEFTGAVAAAGSDISLRDIAALILGDVDASGSLRARAATEITQVAQGDNVTVAGATTLTAPTVTLTEANDFDSDNSGDGVTVSAPGGAVSLTDENSLTLGDIAAADLTLDAGGAVTQEAGSAIDATGTMTVTTPDRLALTEAGNDLTVLNGSAFRVDVVETDGVSIGTLAAQTRGASVTSDGDVIVTGSLQAAGNVTLASTAAGTVGADAGATIRADSNGDSAGDVSLTSTGGPVTGGAGSLIEGVGVTLSGGSTSTDAVTATAGDVSITATASTAALNGDTTATGDVVVTAATAASVSGGGSAQSLSITAQDANLSGASFTATDGTTLTHATDGDIQLGGAEDGVDTTFEVTEAGLNTLDGGPITVSTADGNITSGGPVDLTLGGALDLILLAPGIGDVTVANLSADSLTVRAGTGTVDFDGSVSLSGDLDVAAEDVTQDQTDDLTVAGETNLDVDINVILIGDANDFGDRVNADSDTIFLNDADDLTLGTITALSEIRATAGQSINDTPGSAITAPVGTLTAGTAVTLDNNAIHDFDTLDANARTIIVNDVDGIDLRDVAQTDTNGTLTITARGAITDSGTIDAEGITTFETETADGSGTIVVDGGANTFGGTVSLDTDAGDDGNRADVTLTDNDAQLALGDVTASDATISSTGTGGIAAASGVQDIEGTATYRANAGDVDLSNAANKFAGVINVDADADGNGGAGKVSITDADSVVLGDIDAGALMVTALNGTITDDGAGNATGADVNVDGDTMLTATGAITLDDDGTNFDADGDGTGSVDATGTDVALADEDALILGAVDADTLKVTAGGDITDTAGKTLDIDSLTTLMAAGSDITLDEAHDFRGRVDATGETITLNDAMRLVLGRIDAGTALIASAQAGSVVDRPGFAIEAPTARLTAAMGSVNLDNDALHDFDTVDATGQAVILNDADDLDLGTISQTDAARRLRVTTTGALTDSGTVAAAGETTLTTASADVTLDTPTNAFDRAVSVDTDPGDTGAHADVVLVDSVGSLNLVDVDARDVNFSNTGTGGIDAANGVQDIEGDAIYSTAGAPITLTRNANDFSGTLTLAGGTTQVVDANALTLGSVTVDSLVVTTRDGAITDTATPGETISVAGATSLDAGRFDISLEKADGHDFSSTDTFSANAGDLALREQNGIRLGAISLRGNSDPTVGPDNAGDLRIAAAGTVDQAGAGARVPGTVDITNAGFDVLLSQVNDMTGTINIAGANILLNNEPNGAAAGGVTSLGDIDASGNLTVTTTKSLRDNGNGGLSEDIDVAGTSSLTGADIRLNDASNDFGGAVSATSSGETFLIDANDIALGQVSTGAAQSELRVTAGGSISDTMGQAISTDLARLRAGGAIVLDSDHDFGSVFAEAVAELTLNDVNDLSLLSITAGDAIMVTAGAIDVTREITSTGGTASLSTRAGDIQVDSGVTISAADVLSLDPVGGALTDAGMGAPIMLVSGGDFVLPATDITMLDLVVMADGSVTQTVPSRVLGTLDVQTAGGDIVLDQANTFGTVKADTTKGGADRAEVELTDGTSGLTLDAIIASALTVTANGDIVDVDDSAATAIRVTNATELDAGPGGIVLDNPNHDFGDGVSATATTGVELADRNDLTLATILSDGLLSVTAGRDLQIDDAIDVGDNVALTAGRNLRVANSVDTRGNDLTLTADANGNGRGGVAVRPTGSIDAGAIMASASEGVVLRNTNGASLNVTDAGFVQFGGGTTDISGNLEITSRGNVGDEADASLIVGGTSTITAPGSRIALDSATNDFGGDVEATGQSVSLRDADDISLAEILADAGIEIVAGGDITLSDTDGETLSLDGGAITFGSGLTDIDDTLSIMARGSVLDDPAATLAIGGTTAITAPGQTVSLDSMSNDFMAVVRATANRLTLRDETSLDLARSVIATQTDVEAEADLSVSRSDLADARLVGGGAASVEDVTGKTVTVVADGPARVARFSVVSLDLSAGDTMMVRQGAATTGVTLRGDVDAVVGTLVTPSLMAVDLAATRLDRVGAADASIMVTADEISVGAIRAGNAILQATAGDIRTIDSTAGSTITVAQPSGPDLEVSTDDIAFTDRLVDVSGPLKVSATGNVDLVKAMNAGQRVNNALREVEVDEPVGGALTIETSETIAVTRSDPAITVGSANVTGEKSVSLDVNSLGDTMGRSTGGADDTLLVSGEIAGDATADASGNASINGMIGGDARATATDGNALIEGSVTGDAVADAGGNATIRGNEVVNGANDPTVLGNVTGNAELTAGADATLNARVGGDATVTAGRNSDVSGKVDNDLDIDADNAIVLASKGPLTVDGTLDATSDAEGGGGNTATITQVEAVTVMGATTLDANSQSDITLDNGGNDFTEVAIDGAAKVDLVDDATLDIANIEDVTGDLSIVARNGTLTLQDPGSGDDYRIAANQIWTLQATTGDLTLDGRIDSPEGSPFTGSLVLAGGEDNTIRIKNLIGARSPLNDVTIKDSKNLIFGLRTDGDFTMPEALSESEFLLQPGTEEDIFFVRTLNIQGVDGQILLLVPTETEFIFDFEDAYFGLNIAESDGFNYDGGEAIDLFGSIGGIRSRASGLSPIGPRGGTSEFNNCLIGDPNSCSALTQANVLRLVDVTPDNVFVLDPDQVEQLFLSFGNEELWGLPSVFAIDIADDDDEEDDDESEGTQ